MATEPREHVIDAELANGNPEAWRQALGFPAPAKRVSHSYYVVMCDFGKRGLEAIVHPEDTRRAVVEMLATGESKHVVFIHHIADGLVEDVTDELFDEAEAIARLQAVALDGDFMERSKARMQLAKFDHARALRQEAV